MRIILILLLLSTLDLKAQIEQSLEVVLLPSFTSIEHGDLSKEENERFHHRPASGIGLNYDRLQGHIGFRFGFDLIDSGNRRTKDDMAYRDLINENLAYGFVQEEIQALTIDRHHQHLSIKLLLLLSGQWSSRVRWRMALGPSYDLHQRSRTHSRYSIGTVKYEFKWEESKQDILNNSLSARIETSIDYLLAGNSRLTLGGFYRRTITGADTEFSKLTLTNIGLTIGYGLEF